MTFRLQDGRYEALTQIGVGGASEVWRVVDTRLDVERAIKILHASGTDTDQRRGWHEGKVMARLHNPHIVQVHDVFWEEGQTCVVMELCSGSVAEWVHLNGPMPEALVTRVAISVLRALCVAHENEVIHRDIKPHNILLTEDGQIKVTDFGLAWSSTRSQILTHTGVVLGSLGFMSPEQRRGEGPIFPASDIYALACTMAWMRTGKILGDLYMPPIQDQIHAVFSKSVADILLRAGDFEESKRFKDAKSMHTALEPWDTATKESLATFCGIKRQERPFVQKKSTPSQPTLIAPPKINWMQRLTFAYGLVGTLALVVLALSWIPEKNAVSQADPTPSWSLPSCEDAF